MLDEPIVTFIGGGNMTRCLIEALKKKTYLSEKIIVSNPSKTKLDSLASDFGIRTTSNNSEAAKKANVIILSVKPKFIESVCKEIAPAIKDKKPLIISLATGITTKDILNWIAIAELGIVRTMTNMATAVGLGTTVMFANSFVSTAQKEISEKIFNAGGISFWVDSEEDIKTYTPLVGCTPAHAFLLMEAWTRAAVAVGIPEDRASAISLQVLCGSAALARQEAHVSPEELRRRVTTPAGATEASLKPLLEQNIFFDLFKDSFAKTIKRCSEIEVS